MAVVTYTINQDNVAITDLGTRLSALLSVRAEKVFSIRGDGNLDFSTVAKVMDIGKAAGADHIGLLTSKPTGSSTKGAQASLLRHGTPFIHSPLGSPIRLARISSIRGVEALSRSPAERTDAPPSLHLLTTDK